MTKVIPGAAFANAFNATMEENKPTTILGWFDQLDPEIKERVLKYKKDWWNDDRQERTRSVSHALQQAFIWSMSEEGEGYWRKINDILEKAGK